MADLSGVVARLESVTARLESLAAGGGVGGGDAGEGSTSESVSAFDELIKGKFSEYTKLSKKLGGEVAEQGKLVEDAFSGLRSILVLASKHKTPSQEVLGNVMKSLNSKVSAVVEYCEKRRASKVFNNLMTVKEGIGCVGWVTVSPKPAPYVKECGDQALFYGNRVIKEFKGKNEDQVAWVRAYTGTITELQAYVKTNHTTGLVWNKAGSELTTAPSSGPPGPPAAGGPPPPPPPAIQPPDAAPASKAGADAALRANLFADLNKGAGVTQGLRKVTDSMKTHKNPELRGSSMVKADAVKSTAKSAPKYGAATQTKKPPVLELQNKKWVVEYQEGCSDLAITDTNSKQTVYVFKCVKSTLKVSGKVNSIILDNCKRMALCFDDVISSVEAINSQNVQIQALGRCPTVSIDKTDGCQVFLSKDCIDCEIISAKSSEMNICIPPKTGSGDFIERPVPEQFKTKWNGSALVTETTDITS